jgi:hypothetical protein
VAALVRITKKVLSDATGTAGVKQGRGQRTLTAGW